MGGPVRRVLPVSVRQRLQRSVPALLTAVLQDQLGKPASVQPQRRKHDVDAPEQCQPSNEVALTSTQAGRGPPFPFRVQRSPGQFMCVIQ